MRIGYFSAGFVTGWLVRSSVESSRTLVLRFIHACSQGIEQVRRIVALEREFFEDFASEARAEASASRTAPGDKGEPSHR